MDYSKLSNFYVRVAVNSQFFKYPIYYISIGIWLINNDICMVWVYNKDYNTNLYITLPITYKSFFLPLRCSNYYTTNQSAIGERNFTCEANTLNQIHVCQPSRTSWNKYFCIGI